MTEQGDSSVEDILESIKKVIARDTRAATEQRHRREPPPPTPEPGEVGEAGARHAEDVLDLTEAAPFLDHESARDSRAAAESVLAEPPLVAPAARADIRESLAALAVVAEPPAAPRLVRAGETSLEDLARDLLRPALSAWLDAHLPAMVERLVAAEIARIVGKKG